MILEVTVLNASAVPAILSEGMMIGVSLGKNAPWHGNVIYGISGTTIKIAYIDKFMRGIAVIGCPVSVKYSNDNFVYYFSGIVKDICNFPLEYVSVKIDSAEEMINNRLYPRYDVKLEALVRPLWDDVVYPCTVTDLSYGGAAFLCDHQFDSNDYLEMTLTLPNNATAKLTGKVIRRRYAHTNIINHALQFIECDNTNNKLFTDLFVQLDKEAESIYDRYMKDVGEKP